MKIDFLTAYGFSPDTVTRWQECEIHHLLPLQAHAITHTGLLHGQSLAIFAPTSSGKTFVAELAAMRHFEKGGRTIFLVPTRALANEMSTCLSHTYAPLGLRVCTSTSEHRCHDALIARGEFDFAVVVYEKFRALAANQPELAGLVACVVADELQILNDHERGYIADLMLTKFLTRATPPQFIVLSAVIDDHSRVAEWLGADCLVWHERPVELREGVLDCQTGRFYYREWNSRSKGEEQLVDEDILSAAEYLAPLKKGQHACFAGLATLAQTLTQRNGEQLLVFVPTRNQSIEYARQLSHLCQLASPPSHVVETLHSSDESYLSERLAECVVGGVAFHNADLTPRMRALVERAFDDGHVKILVATSTLAQGVNLRCQNVVSFPSMVAAGEVCGQPVFVPLSRARLRNQGGRAGRYRKTNQPGRAIVLAAESSLVERTFQLFFSHETESLTVRLAPEAMPMACLDVIAAKEGANGIAASSTAPAVSEFFRRTFWSKNLNERCIDAAVDGALRFLTREEFLALANERTRVTGFGKVAATLGFDLETTLFLRDANASLAEMQTPPEFALLLTAAASPEGERFSLPLTRREIESAKYLRLYETEVREQLPELPTLPLGLRGGGVRKEDHSALKKAFLAQAWVGKQPTREIEREFGVYAGTVQGLACHLGWLLEGIAALAQAAMCPPPLAESATELAQRLRWGVPREGLSLACQLGERLSRSHLLALLREGLDTVEAVQEVPLDTLLRILPQQIVKTLRNDASGKESQAGLGGKCLQELVVSNESDEEARQATSLSTPLANRAREASGEKEQRDEGLTSSAKNVGYVDSISIELNPNSPGKVLLAGVELFLSVLPYRLLLYLARHPQRVIPYEEIDAELWPDAKVEQQQILAHKATIVRRFSQVLGTERARAILRTIAGHGLYFDLPRESVRVHKLDRNA